MTEFEVGDFRVRIDGSGYLDIFYNEDRFSLLTRNDMDDLRSAIDRAVIHLEQARK